MSVDFIVPVLIRYGGIMIVDTLEIESILRSKIKNFI